MIIKNIKIVTPQEVIENGCLVIENGLIKGICSSNCSFSDNEIVDGLGLICMPGFIDIHTHGIKGIDYMDALPSDFKKAEQELYKEGVTSFLATTITADDNSLLHVCKNVKEAKNEVKSLLGIHLEGPYINPIYKGAQNPAFIRKADVKMLDKFMEESGDNIRLITLAPEMEGDSSFIKYAKSKGVVLSAGHSDASFKDIEDVIPLGLTNITHVHNAMSKYDHKRPGIVNAALYFDKLYTECICDLVHVHKDTLKSYYKAVGENRFMIITDSLAAKGTDWNNFKLFGLDCIKKEDAIYLEVGPLAGSILKMNVGLKNMHDVCGVDLIGLAKISSTNQASSLGLQDVGKIEVGRKADLVLLDSQFDVKMTLKEGQVVFKK